MTPWQWMRQLRFLTYSLTWPTGTSGAAGSRVVANPVITAGAPAEILGTLRAGPLVLFNVGDGRGDPGAAALGEMTAMMTIAVAASADKVGMAQLVGGPGRAQDDGSYGQTQSEGRGLLEVEEVVLTAIRQGASDLGLSMQVGPPSAAVGGWVADLPVSAREYRLRCKVTSDRYYHAPQRLTASGNVLSWSLPPSRFDRYKVLLRRSAASGAPPASATAGTPVTLSGDLATTVTISGLSAGSYGFSLFMAYDETCDVVAGDAPQHMERFSAQEVGSYRAGVTIT